MSWECKLLDIVRSEHISYDPPKVSETSGALISGETVLVDSSGKQHHYRELPIGTMFSIPPMIDEDEWPWYHAGKEDLADYYFQNNTHRRPLFVILPDHTLFLLDGKCWKDGVKYGGWKVTGQVPKITVEPSININGFYHGFLRDGVLSDDVDGLIYNN